MSIDKGFNGLYHWMETDAFPFWETIKTFPELVLDNYIMLNAFDSGPVKWDDEEIAKGFGYVNGVAVTSKLNSITDVKDLPLAEYDEWYVSTKPFECPPSEVFVNYGIFSLKTRDFENDKISLDKTSDFKGLEVLIDTLTELQIRFWSNLESVFPDKFFGQSDNKFIFVTKDLSEIQELERHIMNILKKNP